MKNVVYFITSMLALPFLGWGQGDCSVLELSKPQTSGEYSARDMVKLNKKFTSVQGAAFRAFVDETIVCDVEYHNPVDPNRPLNTDKPVGTIAGTVDVSPTGAATYQIPIFTPPGTAGMEPQISIVYNSQGGNGLLGVGWDIAGLSAITRTGQTIYHDGKTTPINLDNTDRLVLDGNRLISTDGTTYGDANSTYATEMETFSKITALNTGVNRWFKVETKDGMTLEYGNTNDSRLFIGLNPEALSLKLNKVTDANGNFMTYTYKKVFYGLFGESLIEKIEYTGNSAAGQTPYATITFLYSNREDIQESYVAGFKMQSTSLLRGIKVESEGQILRRYWFNYAKIGLYSHLIEIIEEGSDGKSPNSTIVQYDPISATGHEHNEYVMQDLFEYQTVCTFVDLNKDGKEDIITINTDSPTAWYAYAADVNGYTHGFSRSESDNGNVKNIRIFVSRPDVIGTPHVFVEKHYELKDSQCNRPNKNFSCHKFVYKEYEPRYYVSNPNTFTFICVNEFETTYPIRNNFTSNFPHLKTGDVYGDGTIHYILTNGYVHDGGKPSYDFFSLTIEKTSLQSFDWGKVYDFYFIDFDGDGADELLVQTANSLKIYKFKKGVNTPELIYTLSYNYDPVYSYSIKFGDFNGDGKTDILIWNTNSSEYLNIYFSTGTGLTEPYQIHSSDYFVSKYIYTGDMNGDGKDDIIHVNSKTIDVYYSYGNGTFTKENFSIDTEVNINALPSFVSHYKGNGKASFLIRARNNDMKATMHELHFWGKELNNRAIAIADGLNNKTQFEYQPLTKGGSFYTREMGIASGDGVMNFQGALYAVSKMTQPNGLGEPNETNSISFSYKGAKIHRRGKGFLAFSEITMNNVATGITTINKYEYDTIYFNASLKETKTQLTSGSDINTITRTNGTYHFGSKRIMPYTTKTVTNDHLTGFTVTETFPEYDFENGNLKKKKTVYGSDVFTETTDCFYDSYGNWGPKNRITEQKITTTHADDPSSTYVRTVNYVYDGNGNLITETTDNGITTNYQDLNVFGLPETVIVTAPDALSYSKTLQYDDRKKFITSVTDPLGTTSQEYSPAGNLQYEIDITGQKTSYKYDGFGRQTGTKTPEGHIITTNYGWENINSIKSISYIEVTAPGRPTTRTYYDVLGREVRSKAEGYNGQMIVTDQEYNAQGQLDRTSLPYFDGGTPQWTENEYYNDGRIKTVTAKLATNLATDYVYNNNVTTITSPDGRSVAKTYNAHGDLVKVVENGKGDYAINYKYHCSGQPNKIIMDQNKVTVMMDYDDYGRQTTLTDPNAGLISYTYNAFGDMLTQTDFRGKVTENIYDNLRRMDTQKMTDEPDKKWNYHTSGSGKGQLKSITSSQSEQHYEYGDFGRLTKMTEKVVGDQSFVTQYAYDQYGNKTEITYPGGFKIKRIYNNKGYVTEIRQAGNDQLIWQRLTENALGQPLTYQMGNGKTTTCQYNGYNLPVRVSTPNIQDFSYNIDSTNGNMKWRQDNGSQRTLKEDFYYDELNRLTIANHNLYGNVMSIQYYPNGNISIKSDAGTYNYIDPFPAHAVDKIITYPGQELLNSGNQEIEYTAFNKAAIIYNNSSQRLVIDYGVDQQRMRSRFYTGHIFLKKTKYFATNYEKEVISDTIREINYISTPYGVLAAYIKENSNRGEIYYLYKDHLGSITTITNASGTVKDRRSFDAWGRLRNPDNWTYNAIPAMSILDRGYTGHEHLPQFGLINMNGRMYDPLIGLMLSPDPYVSMPESMQGFNRYNYCLNNPLKYTDPSGEWIHIPIMAAIGGIANVIANWKTIDGNFLKGFVTFNVGAGQGALTAVCPAAGMLAGSAITGASNSLVAQTGPNFSGMNNVNWGYVAGSAGISVAASMVSYGVGQSIGGGMGALLGGAAGNITGQVLSNGGFSKIDWTSVAISGVSSYGMYHLSSYVNWRVGVKNQDFYGRSIKYNQYLRMQASYARARFWRSERAGGGFWLTKDGISDEGVSYYKDPEKGNRVRFDFSQKPEDAWATFHPHPYDEHQIDGGNVWHSSVDIENVVRKNFSSLILNTYGAELVTPALDFCINFWTYNKPYYSIYYYPYKYKHE